MNITPYIFLCVGSIFTLLYAFVTIFGWSKTRKNRRLFQNNGYISELNLYNIESGTVSNQTYKTFSLQANHFFSAEGDLIDVSKFNTYIAEGESSTYPGIKSGDLIFLNKNTKEITYAFTLPNLSNYR